MTQQKDPLTERLTSLPEVRASTGFTDRVLNRLDEPWESEQGHAKPLAWSAAAAVALVVAALVLRPAGIPKAERLSAEVTEIRSQHLLLTEELDRLRTRTQNAAPMLYLAGNDRVDYVLDLSPFILSEIGHALPASTVSNSPEPKTF